MEGNAWHLTIVYRVELFIVHRPLLWFYLMQILLHLLIIRFDQASWVYGIFHCENLSERHNPQGLNFVQLKWKFMILELSL